MARVRSVGKNSPSRALNGYNISEPIAFAPILVILDVILVSVILSFVPYTKIDWDAYMSQVDGFLGGERDYSKLKGDTGSLVYSAGFLYVYSAIQFITGGQLFPAQVFLLFTFSFVEDSFPNSSKADLFFGVEICWNIYPSSLYSSLLLLCIHLSILWGLSIAPSEYPYIDQKPSQRK